MDPASPREQAKTLSVAARGICSTSSVIQFFCTASERTETERVTIYSKLEKERTKIATHVGTSKEKNQRGVGRQLGMLYAGESNEGSG